MLKRHVISFLLSLFCIAAQCQVISGVTKDGKTHKPLDYVSVVAMDSLGSPIAFQNTASDGSFALRIPDGKVAASVSISHLGYATIKIPMGDYRQGMTINMRQDAINIKEVEVKSRRLQQRSDTLVYSVAGFRQKQDRSIADVIAKLPGMEVSDKGMITYQGKPINKFYIEGMDLMGSKYAMASENLSAKKVKNVEVLRNHQPIKALKGISFSDQAAVNLVLEDDAKNVINGLMEIGGGAQVQRGTGDSFLRDGRAVAMMFGKKSQNLTMYKWNNTGKDIQHEIRDLASTPDMDGQDSWLSDITVSAPDLKLERYNCNDTRIVATNWLLRTGKNADLRFQSTYLFDNTIGYRKDETTYTNILGLPVAVEETDANKYRREADAGLQYKQNQDSIYIENYLKASADWNESSAATTLNGSIVRQAVEPRKRGVGDSFNLIKKLSNGRSLNLKAIVNYQYLPGRLLTATNTPQRLNIESVGGQVATGFRHRLLGMFVSYDAQLSYHHDDIEATMEETRKASHSDMELKLTPRLSFERASVRAAINLPFNVASYRLSGSKANKVYVSPYLYFGYKPNGALDITFYYSHQYDCLDIRNNVPMTYFTDYTTRVKGNGKLDFTPSDNFTGKVDYSNPNAGLFAYISGSYVRTGDMPMFTYDYENNIYTMQALDLKSSNEQMQGSAEVSKAFGYGKTTLALGCDALRDDYSAWISEQACRCHLLSYSAHFKIAFMPSPLFSLEETSTFGSIKTENATLPDLSSKALRSFSHKLTAYLMPCDWQIAWSNELYHGNDNSVNTACFSDFKVTYTRKRYELSLGVNNIFGTTKYERRTVTASTMLYTVNRLRPRELMAKLSFSL